MNRAAPHTKNSFRVLHISPFNTAGVPYTFVKAEQELGLDSRLITLKKHTFEFGEDICLNAPFITTPGMKTFKSVLQYLKRKQPHKEYSTPPVRNHSEIEKRLFAVRDVLWNVKFGSFLKKFDVFSFNLVHLDGGKGFFSDSRIIKEMINRNIPVICTYLGSDLRVRGIDPEIDRLSSCNFTVEVDHMKIYPGIHWLPFPFDFSDFHFKTDVTRSPIVVGHAPSNCVVKGTDFILETLHRLKKKLDFEILLIENITHKQALNLKSTCSIFIDQLTDIGFGINAIESLAMGIPTLTSLVSEYRDMFPDAPFIEITKDNLEQELYSYITSVEKRTKLGGESYDWVRKNHDKCEVLKQMYRRAAECIPSLKDVCSHF